MDTSDVTSAARSAGDHPAVEGAARLGYAVSGVLHLVIAWLALQVAWTTGGGSADQSGALRTLASSAVGVLLLWLAVAGFAGLALWQVTDAVIGHPGKGEAPDRAKAVGKAVVYLVLALSCLSFARGGGTDSSAQSVDVTAALMAQSGGRILVGLVGLAVVAVGGYHVVKGWKRTFLRDLEGHPGTVAERAGRVGYIAKGVALAVVGLLFVSAAVQSQPDRATGLDGALHALLGQPFGPILLTLVALGFAGYGLYSFARARHATV